MNISKLFNTHKKNAFGVLLALGLVVIVFVLFQYNSDKSTHHDAMTNASQGPVMPSPPQPTNELSSASTLSDESYLPVNGGNMAPPQPPASLNPGDLLPRDMNSEWASINPASNDLQGVNLLTAGQLIGINTIGNSLRNPNLQLRSEPIIPKADLGPWNQSTMEPDMFRRPLEIGGPGGDL